MGLPSLVDLTTELEKFLTATWHAVRAFSVAWRSYSRLEQHQFEYKSSEGSELPAAYGRTRLVVLPVDPYAVRAYWEVTPGAGARAAGRLGECIDQLQAVLRFEDRSLDVPPFDIEINLAARDWYIPLWSAGKSFGVVLGVRNSTGRFALLASSGVTTPRAWPRPAVEEEFVKVSEEGIHVERIAPPEIPRTARLKMPAISVPASVEAMTDIDITASAEQRFVAGFSSNPDQPTGDIPEISS